MNNRNLFLIVLEAGKSKIKISADSVSVEDCLPGLHMAACSLCPLMADREREKFLSSSYKSTVLLDYGLTLMNSFYLNYYPIYRCNHMRIMASICEFQRNKFI